MSHIKDYIKKSLLIPHDIKESLVLDDIHQNIQEDLSYFMDKYIPLEKEILTQVNTELELLSTQIRKYLQKQEWQLQKQEMKDLEQEIACL